MGTILNAIKSLVGYFYLACSAIGFSVVLGTIMNFYGFIYGNVLYFSGLVPPASLLIAFFRKTNPYVMGSWFCALSSIYLLIVLFNVGFHSAISGLANNLK